MFVSFNHFKRKIMGTQELIQYEPLEKEFMGRGSQRGWKFRELKREWLYALYEKVSEEGDVYYEVIWVNRDKGGIRVIGGVEVEFKPKERYPSDEGFGVSGWSYGLLGDAEDRFSSLVGALEPSSSII
jgi:hypothetical protein